jgi:hypothetical protein
VGAPFPPLMVPANELVDSDSGDWEGSTPGVSTPPVGFDERPSGMSMGAQRYQPVAPR